MIVYKVTNQVNNKIYIGKTTRTMAERKGEHMYDVRHNSSFAFHKALKKYGEENFKWTIIQKCYTMTHLNLAEQAYIELYILKGYTLYNMTEGGDGGLGYKHTEESKKKISLATKGKICSDEQKKFLSGKFKGRISNRKGAKLTVEQKKRISETQKGKKKKPHSEETKRKISESNKGKIHKVSEETRKKISQSNKGKILAEETKRKLSEINKGKTVAEDVKKKISLKTKGVNNPMYGKKHSLDTVNKIKEAARKRKEIKQSEKINL